MTLDPAALQAARTALFHAFLNGKNMRNLAEITITAYLETERNTQP